MTNFMSDGATVAALGPIVLPMATLANVSAVKVGLITSFSSSFANFLVVGTPNNAICFGMGRDPETGERLLEVMDFVKYGLPVTVSEPPPSRPEPASKESPEPEVSTPAPAPPADTPPGRYVVYVSSNRVEAFARETLSALRRQGYDASIWEVDIPGKGHWFRVVAGSFDDRDAARALRTELRGQTRWKDASILRR